MNGLPNWKAASLPKSGRLILILSVLCAIPIHAMFDAFGWTDVIVGVKTGGSRVGGPDLCVKADGNRKQGTQMFTQVRVLTMEVKPYFLLD